MSDLGAGGRTRHVLPLGPGGLRRSSGARGAQGRGGTKAARSTVLVHLGEQLRVDREAAVHGVTRLGAQPLRKLSLHLVRGRGRGGVRRGRIDDWVGEEVLARGGLRVVR